MKRTKRSVYTILGMLTVEPMSGYEIKNMIQTSTSFFWSESDGQIYPALAACVESGWATVRESATDKTARVKKIYKITAAGKKELAEWLSQQAQPTLVRNEMLLKLFFGNHATPEHNQHHLKHREIAATQELKIYKSLRKQLNQDYSHSQHLPFWLITLDYGIKIVQAELRWCKDALIMLPSK